MDALIRYVCVAEPHARPAAGSRGDLTVHQSSWAYCPAEARDAHSWRSVDGVTVDGLRRFGLRLPSEVAGS